MSITTIRIKTPSPILKLLQCIPRHTRPAQRPTVALRAGTCYRMPVRFAHHASTLCEEIAQKAICHRRCRYDRPYSSGSVSGPSSYREHYLDMAMQPYDVVGPICESSDCFGKNVMLNATERGDLIAYSVGRSLRRNHGFAIQLPPFARTFDRIK